MVCRQPCYLPVLVEGVVFNPEGVLSKGVEDVVAHRRHWVLGRLEVHHLLRHLRSGNNAVAGVDGGVSHKKHREEKLGKNLEQFRYLGFYRSTPRALPGHARQN